ncbi:MAG: hypothetical protein IKP10_05380 [Clostridia bacterium]|nr:hypothetical protein [Clostridia bacterium]
MKKTFAILLALVLCIFSVSALAEGIVESAEAKAAEVVASAEAAVTGAAEKAVEVAKSVEASAEAAVKEAAKGFPWLWVAIGAVVVIAACVVVYKRKK